MRRKPVHNLNDLLSHGKRMENGCLEWQRARNWANYGLVYFKGKTRKAHRVAAYFLFGTDLNNMRIDVRHTCDNPPCFEKEHLIPGTKSANTKDAFLKGRRKLPKGGGRYMEGQFYRSW